MFVACGACADLSDRLGAHAFHGVLSLKSSTYAHTGLLRELLKDTRDARFIGERRKLGQIARRSLETMVKELKF